MSGSTCKRRLAIVLGTAVCCTGVASAQGEKRPQERSAFFGDLHIHTMFSHDAFVLGTRTSPDDAYRYAKGEPIPSPSGGVLRISGPPLDFLAVTDHSEFLGVIRALMEPGGALYDSPEKAELVGNSGDLDDYLSTAQVRLRQLATQGGPLAKKIADTGVIADAWKREIAAAERHYAPGRFTTFIAYEYTPGRGGRHLHRNVFFRGSEVPEAPFSSVDSPNPEDLWNWLDGLRSKGIEVLAIPHNMNQSDGLAFGLETWTGAPIDAAFAEKRVRNEPLAEITQQKGTSETHPSLSPNDEWANFEIVQYYLNRAENKDPISVFEGGYYRDALETGLELEERIGVNPYRLGVAGASDSHVAAGSFEEGRHFSSRDTPQARGSAYRETSDGWEGFFTPRQATHSTGGLTGVWAEENTREAIFDALRRRETFATSGVRVRVRFFGGFGLAERLTDATDPVGAAYQHGVAMGGTLTAAARGSARRGSRTPSFLVWALRDPNSGWLQRAQVVKGWIEEGEAREQVIDVACSDGLAPDPRTRRCPDNGARVNLADCSIRRDVGATELRTVWTDPDFDPKQRAFYYLRVLENPSCRWSTWDAIRLGIEPNPDLETTIQERAWSSPIWYQP